MIVRKTICTAIAVLCLAQSTALQAKINCFEKWLIGADNVSSPNIEDLESNSKIGIALGISCASFPVIAHASTKILKTIGKKMHGPTFKIDSGVKSTIGTTSAVSALATLGWLISISDRDDDGKISQDDAEWRNLSSMAAITSGTFAIAKTFAALKPWQLVTKKIQAKRALKKAATLAARKGA